MNYNTANKENIKAEGHSEANNEKQKRKGLSE
jgi:hypothetical protein